MLKFIPIYIYISINNRQLDVSERFKIHLLFYVLIRNHFFILPKSITICGCLVVLNSNSSTSWGYPLIHQNMCLLCEQFFKHALRLNSKMFHTISGLQIRLIGNADRFPNYSCPHLVDELRCTSWIHDWHRSRSRWRSGQHSSKMNTALIKLWKSLSIPPNHPQTQPQSPKKASGFSHLRRKNNGWLWKFISSGALAIYSKPLCFYKKTLKFISKCFLLSKQAWSLVPIVATSSSQSSLICIRNSGVPIVHNV